MPKDTPLGNKNQRISATKLSQHADLSQELSSATYRPTAYDIICGRGRGSFLHEGNKVYLSLLKENTDHYTKATKRIEKTIIISTVVSSLKDRGFRFIRQGAERNEGWYELSDQECWERTGHGIRDLIRKKKARDIKKRRSKTAPRPPTPTDSDSSTLASEKAERKKPPSKQGNEGLNVDQQPSKLPQETFTEIARSLADNTIDRPKDDDDADSFDEQIGQIPPEVMSPTDRLSDGFDIFFETNRDDVGRMLNEIDKQHHVDPEKRVTELSGESDTSRK